MYMLGGHFATQTVLKSSNGFVTGPDGFKIIQKVWELLIVPPARYDCESCISKLFSWRRAIHVVS